MCLQQLRKAAQLSQAEVARRVGVGRSTLCLYEHGLRIPRLSVLPKLAAVLGVTVEEIVKCFE